MNGHDAAREIRKLEARHTGHVPIVALSGNARCSHIQNALNAGMVNRYLIYDIDDCATR